MEVTCIQVTWIQVKSGSTQVSDLWGQFLKKILTPLAILSMERTMVAKVISEFMSVSRLKLFPETRLCLVTLPPSINILYAAIVINIADKRRNYLRLSLTCPSYSSNTSTTPPPTPHPLPPATQVSSRCRADKRIWCMVIGS